MTETIYGSKYSRDLDIAEIAKLVRADIKAAVKAGTIPDAAYRVRISRFAGGQSLDVRVGNILERDGRPCVWVHNPRRLGEDMARPHGANPHEFGMQIFAPAIGAMLDAVKAIVGAYNFDGSDSQSDYYHVNFYGHVEMETAYEIAQRDAEQGMLRTLSASSGKSVEDIGDSIARGLEWEIEHRAAEALKAAAPATAAAILEQGKAAAADLVEVARAIGDDTARTSKGDVAAPARTGNVIDFAAARARLRGGKG